MTLRRAYLPDADGDWAWQTIDDPEGGDEGGGSLPEEWTVGDAGGLTIEQTDAAAGTGLAVVMTNPSQQGIVVDGTALGSQENLLALNGPGNDPSLYYGSDGSLGLTDANGDDFVSFWGTGEVNLAQTEGQKIGFFGEDAVVQPTGVAVTAEAIHAALVTLGLIAP